MAPKVDDTNILNKIQGTYVPFLKKLIAFLEKNKKATPENLTKLRAIYTIFTTANSREQIETFHANQKKLENWYNKSQKDKHSEDGDTSKGRKRSFTCSDTESSQGACDSASQAPPTKKACTSFENSVDPDQPAILKVQSVAAPLTFDPANIKKEKMQQQQQKEQEKDKQKEQEKEQEQEKEPAEDEPVVFTCASCQFQTTEEAEFMKHARTDHRTDLSMWCKRCGKCFSNAGVLVSHIKDRRACAREEMVYRCGVKGCVFETASGQTFVHHLRHCHKGSPFIFCVHCQKIFTLPHCLILHMQDDCPFKDRNRRGGADKGPADTPTPAAAPTPAAPAPVTRPITQTPAPIVVTPARTPAATVGRASPQSAPPTRGLSSVGRGRGAWSRGRGRGRNARLRHDSDEDTSDSDDPDDPSWRPEECLGDTGLRRSGRWAKRVNDVLNAEPTAAQQQQQGAAFKMQMVSCPCCDFLAAFQSVLEDHYIANHKAPNRNSCVVCKLKFENTPAFLQHFEEHRKGALPNEPPIPTATTTTATQQKEQQLQKEQPPKQRQQPEEPKQQQPEEPSKASSDPNNKAVLPLIPGQPGVVEASTCRQGAVKIPYQSAIHEKNNLRAGLGKFEELKSPSDLSAMKTDAKLRHLFKCALYSCPFTTDSKGAFEEHLRAQHSGRRLQCGYCFREEASPVLLASHVASAHGARTFQCSGCFYRASSKSHLRVHARTAHPDGDPVRILSCKEVFGSQEQEEEQQHTMWPFICAIDACSFSTYDPGAFKRHNETVHRTTSVYFCFYCKVDFLTFKRLMNHYRLHGLNLYQCQHCVHGAETEEEILAHLCNAHPDKEFRAYKRGGGGGAQNDDGKQEAPAVPNDNTNNKGVRTRTDEDELLYQAIDNDCYPAHMRSRRRCYPRYLRHVATEVVCGHCCDPKVFPSLEQYLAHLRDDHGAVNFPCPHCWETCATVDDFRNHLLCHASKLYVCGAEGCSFYDWKKETVTWHAKQNHKKGADGEGPGSVALREFKALEEEENRVHALQSPTSEDGQQQPCYSCPFCGLKGRDRNLMKNHLYHELSYLRFECALCGRRCASRREVREHFVAAHPESDVACSADSHSELESAVKAALKQPSPDIGETTCDACCTKFETAAMLQFHVRVCLCREYRPYECAPCSRRFATLLMLRHHSDEAHTDPWTSVQFAHSPNDAVERDLGRNLQKMRLRQLKDALGEPCAPAEDCKVKFYTCSECPYEAHHKYGVERHARLEHGGEGRVMKGVESGATTKQRPFGCGHCSKRASTRPEVERHVRAAHDGEGFFYYSPDPAHEGDELEIYECAYCKSTRESLGSLRKHAQLMHADMEFKVKGSVSAPASSGDALACGHCYLSVGGTEELRAHTGTAHPLLQPKSLGSVAKSAASEDFPNKRVRFASDDVHVCGHCGGAFSGRDQLTAHSKRAHSRLSPRFEVLRQGGDARFYKCEFCRFTGERRFLERHLSAKHRMRVTCRHCGKRFEFASRCKEHHEVAHPGTPLSYSHETLSPSEGGQQAQQPEHREEEEPMEEDEGGEEEDVLDLSAITVHMEVKDGESAELPLVYVTERFNLFPRVVVRDVMKGGH